MPRAGSASWWAAKVRQARAFGRASVASAERTELAAWLTPLQIELFSSMHVADQRHGLDVAAWLRSHGETNNEVLLAGLLHDAGKGNTGFWPRVVYSLSQVFGKWVTRLAMLNPRMRASLARLIAHADVSADLAQQAGCSPLTVELIRTQGLPPGDETARRFHLADEAN